MPTLAVLADPSTRPLNFQMTAGSTDYIEAACARVLEHGVDAVDINIGCPATTIIRSGSGSALMGNLPLLARILTCFRSAVGTHAMTVKMRAGFKEYNAERVAQIARDCGADAIVVHPRLQSQKFRGVPDYTIVANVKKIVDIPILVSGGITHFEQALAVYERTGVDGFLIGRAQLGKPWLMHEFNERLAGRSYRPTRYAVREAVERHMRGLETLYGAKGLPLAQRHIGFYAHGCPGSHSLRLRAHHARSWNDMHALVDDVVEVIDFMADEERAR